MALSFPRFQELPLELQHRVWFYCLPRRVAEKERLWYLDGMPLAQSCNNPAKRIRQNDGMPLIASVCREARQLVLRYGYEHVFDEKLYGRRDEPAWVQPKLDTLHLNWCMLRYFDSAWETVNGPLKIFVNSAAEEGMPVSVMAPLIITFPVEKHPKHFTHGAYLHIHVPKQEDELDLATIYQGLPPASPVDVVLTSVSFHIPRAKASESGCFGLLGDAPVQTVPCSDKSTLRKYYDFFRACSLGQAEPETARHFDLIGSDIFQDQVDWWVQSAEWLLLANMWQTDYKTGKLTADEAGRVWCPVVHQIDKRASLSLQDHTFDNAHPWVQEYRRKLIKLRPVVMFRHCTEPCV